MKQSEFIKVNSFGNTNPRRLTSLLQKMKGKMALGRVYLDPYALRLSRFFLREHKSSFHLSVQTWLETFYSENLHSLNTHWTSVR